MINDDKLSLDELQRFDNYEQVKSYAEAEVNQEIAGEVHRARAKDRDDIKDIAEELSDKAANEVIETNREIERGRSAARVSQIVDYIFFVIYGLLSIRLILELFAARESAGFVKFIKSATGLLYQPFAGIVPSPTVDGGFTLALPIVVAIVVYALLHLAINGILRMLAHRKTHI